MFEVVADEAGLGSAPRILQDRGHSRRTLRRAFGPGCGRDANRCSRRGRADASAIPAFAGWCGRCTSGCSDFGCRGFHTLIGAAEQPKKGAPAPLPPTLDDVARLTHACDHSRSVAPDVNACVKNAALKKFFTDPLCDAIDGLGAHIDDHGQPDPMPLAMPRRLRLSKFLGLLDHSEQGRPPTDQGRVIAGGPSTDKATPLLATDDPANVASALHGPVAATTRPLSYLSWQRVLHCNFGRWGASGLRVLPEDRNKLYSQSFKCLEEAIWALSSLITHR